ncbi:MAG: MarC family protein, partial [Alysiella sp.]|uniref:MarC family protein n=1 Tax=Alysiella sp. TaxID=1872483 RepID=UPI0026DA710D
MSLSQTLQIFLAFLVLINPFTALAYFVSATQNFNPPERNRVIRTACISLFIIITVATFAGKAILDTLGISVPSFRVVGGILLFLIALAMVGGN